MRGSIVIFLTVLAFSGLLSGQRIADQTDTNPDPDRLMTFQDYVNENYDPEDRESKINMLTSNTAGLFAAAKASIEGVILAIKVSGVLMDPNATALLDAAFPSDLESILKALCDAVIWIDIGGATRDGVSYPGDPGNLGLGADMLCEDPSPDSFGLLIHEGGHLVNFPGWGSAREQGFDDPDLVAPAACDVFKFNDENLSFLFEKYFLDYLLISPSGLSSEQYCESIIDAYDASYSYLLKLRSRIRAHQKARNDAVAAGTISPTDKQALDEAITELDAARERLAWTIVLIRQCATAHGCE